MSILVDTSVWIDYLRGVDASHVVALENAMASRTIFMPDVALAEILLGLRSDKVAEKIEAELREFEVINVGGRQLAIQAARNYRLLRAEGKTVRSTVDLMIGTWCIEEKVPLLHNDRDYHFMEQHLGLKNASSELLS